MAREEIIEKLDKFLTKYPAFEEDCHVVYLLVEIRKLLDRDTNPNFLLVRFYCDWTVHTTKERNLGVIKEIVDKIDKCYLASSHHPIKDKGIFDFLNMNELKKELRELFDKYTLPKNIFEDDSWLAFVDILTGVLSDQPILKPKAGIESISLVSFGKGKSTIDIKFNDGRTDSMAGGER